MKFMQMAAKEKTVWLWMIALVCAFCTPKTWAELSAGKGTK